MNTSSWPDAAEITALLCKDSNCVAAVQVTLPYEPKMAKRAGLLHDIGKVPSIEKDIETPHAILGMQWAEKFGEHTDVCNAIGAHHDEIEMTSLLSPIVQVCDAISGARPGARRQTWLLGSQPRPRCDFLRHTISMY